MLPYMSCYWLLDLEYTFWSSPHLVVLMCSAYISVFSCWRYSEPKIKYDMLMMKDVTFSERDTDEIKKFIVSS